MTLNQVPSEQQFFGDLLEAEADLWREATEIVGAAKLDLKDLRLAEASFKAGLSSGAGWMVSYLKRLGLLAP